MAAPGLVALERLPRRLADREQPFPAPLAEHADLLAFVVEGTDVQVYDLLAAQPARVGELEHRPIAQLQGRPGRYPLEQASHLLGAEHPRQLLLALGAGDEVGRVLPHLLIPDQE